jgi:hypothetical protein
LVILPAVGHFPQVEAPLAVADTLDDFIANSSPWHGPPRHADHAEAD